MQKFLGRIYSDVELSQDTLGELAQLCDKAAHRAETLGAREFYSDTFELPDGALLSVVLGEHVQYATFSAPSRPVEELIDELKDEPVIPEVEFSGIYRDGPGVENYIAYKHVDGTWVAESFPYEIDGQIVDQRNRFVDGKPTSILRFMGASQRYGTDFYAESGAPVRRLVNTDFSIYWYLGDGGGRKFHLNPGFRPAGCTLKYNALRDQEYLIVVTPTASSDKFYALRLTTNPAIGDSEPDTWQLCETLNNRHNEVLADGGTIYSKTVSGLWYFNGDGTVGGAVREYTRTITSGSTLGNYISSVSSFGNGDKRHIAERVRVTVSDNATGGSPPFTVTEQVYAFTDYTIDNTGHNNTINCHPQDDQDPPEVIDIEQNNIHTATDVAVAVDFEDMEERVLTADFSYSSVSTTSGERAKTATSQPDDDITETATVTESTTFKLNGSPIASLSFSSTDTQTYTTVSGMSGSHSESGEVFIGLGPCDLRGANPFLLLVESEETETGTYTDAETGFANYYGANYDYVSDVEVRLKMYGGSHAFSYTLSTTHTEANYDFAAIYADSYCNITIPPGSVTVYEGCAFIVKDFKSQAIHCARAMDGTLMAQFEYRYSGTNYKQHYVEGGDWVTLTGNAIDADPEPLIPFVSQDFPPEQP